MKNYKILFVIGLMIPILLFTTGCGEKETVKIGFIATLTGTNSEIGIGIRDGFLLKVEEINESGGIDGRKIEVLIKDDTLDFDLIEQYDKEFIEMGVVAIFGHELSSKAKPMVNATEGEEIIVISPTLSTYEMSGKDDNFFRTITTNYDQGTALGDYALGKSKKVLVTYDSQNAKFAQGVYEGFLDEFQGELGYYPVEVPVETIESDYIATYKEGQYDGVLYIMNPHDVMYISQLLFRNKIDANIYSSNWGMATNQFEEGGRSIDGAVFVSLLGELDNEKFNIFEEKFIKKYKKRPEFASIYSYESASLFFKALEMSKSLNYADIKNQLLAIEQVEGLIDDFELDEYGDVSRPTHIGVVKDGALEILD